MSFRVSLTSPLLNFAIKSGALNPLTNINLSHIIWTNYDGRRAMDERKTALIFKAFCDMNRELVSEEVKKALAETD